MPNARAKELSRTPPTTLLVPVEPRVMVDGDTTIDVVTTLAEELAATITVVVNV